jgi:hypothetical protein
MQSCSIQDGQKDTGSKVLQSLLGVKRDYHLLKQGGRGEWDWKRRLKFSLSYQFEIADTEV